ncbi:MAG: ABC transporter ATP-binding protein [Candidatus Omnitrophica bacterium]|nr:ABC transporter ATP-binding protein [Candidatus Omnitrophota bacterium]
MMRLGRLVRSEKLRLLARHVSARDLATVALLTLLQPLFEVAKLGVLLALIRAAFQGGAAQDGSPIPLPLLNGLLHQPITTLVALFIGLVAVQTLFDLWLLIAAERARFGMVERLRRTAVEKLWRLDLEFFSRAHAGDLVFTFHGAVDKAGIVVDLITQALKSVLTLAVLLWFLLAMSPIIAAAIIGIGAVAWLVLFQVVETTRRASIRLSGITREAMNRLHDIVYGIRLIRTAGNEVEESSAYLETCRAAFPDQLRSLLTRYSTTLATNTIGLAVVLAGVAYAIASGKTGGELPAFVLSYLVLLRQAAPNVVQLNDLRFQFAHADGYFNTVVELLGREEPPAPPASIGAAALSREIARHGLSLAAEELVFRYEGGSDVLHGLSIECLAGQATGIVGLSGAGKSTLLDCLAGFRRPAAGRVRLAGVDLGTIAPEAYRRMVGYVSQEAVIFNRSILENIRYGMPEKSLEQVQAAAERAQAHDFIMRTPRGYQSELGERGLSVSGGERQRIALARLFLQDPPMIILDEATSWLDVQTEAAVFEQLLRLRERKILLVVSHRFTSVKRFDRILVLQGGRVVEAGRSDELLARQGVYHGLFS